MFNQRIFWLSCLRQLASSNKGRLMHAGTETPPQYDVSEKMKRLFELKQKQRESARAYYQKIIMNPHRSKNDGVPFDPVLFRFNALKTYNVEYFRPNLSNTFLFIVLYILPIFILCKIMYMYHERSEREIRSGKIAYKDRYYKNAL